MEHRIVQDLLQHVSCFGAAFEQEHPLGEIGQPAGGTRFVIAGVGQFVVLAKRLVLLARPDAAGDRHPPQRRAVPEAVGGQAVVSVARFDRHIGHARGEEDRAHGMAFQRPLISQRNGILEIRPRRGPGRGYVVPSTPFDERLGQFQITSLACRAVEFGQGHLQLGMAAEARPSVRSKELLARLIRRSAGDVQECRLAGHGLVFHCRLDQVPQYVAVMAAIQEGRVPRRLAGVRDVGMDVAVRPLGRRDLPNDFVHPPFQLRVREQSQGVGDRFQHLVQIGFAPGAVRFAGDRFPRRPTQARISPSTYCQECGMDRSLQMRSFGVQKRSSIRT